jgi:hypothetical protein
LLHSVSSMFKNVLPVNIVLCRTCLLSRTLAESRNVSASWCIWYFLTRINAPRTAANDFDAKNFFRLNRRSAREYTIFIPAQLWCKWRELRPSNECDLVTEDIGKVLHGDGPVSELIFVLYYLIVVRLLSKWYILYLAVGKWSWKIKEKNVERSYGPSGVKNRLLIYCGSFGTCSDSLCALQRNVRCFNVCMDFAPRWHRKSVWNFFSDQWKYRLWSPVRTMFTVFCGVLYWPYRLVEKMRTAAPRNSEGYCTFNYFLISRCDSRMQFC